MKTTTRNALITIGIALGLSACSSPSNTAGMNKEMPSMGSMGAMAMGSGSMSSKGITAALEAILRAQGIDPADYTITSRVARANGSWSISALRPTSGAVANGAEASYAFMQMPAATWELRAQVPMTTGCAANSVRGVPGDVRAEVLDGCR